MIFKPDYFELYELLPENFYEQNFDLRFYGDMLWWLFDPRVLLTADRIRVRFNSKMLANTWHWGGEHHYRGWRPFDCSEGTRFSQHKFGRGLDLVPISVTAYEIREDILRNPGRSEYEFITCLEIDIPWLHFDCRNWDVGNSGIKLVRP